jgi:hypothetical protein
MSKNLPERPRAENPHHEPEILLPGEEPRDEASGQESFESIFIRIDEDGEGFSRIHVARPGPFSILIGLLAIGFVVAILVLLLLGAMLIWVPLMIAGLLLAAFSRPLRNLWRQIRGG